MKNVEQPLPLERVPFLNKDALQSAIFNNPNFSCIATDTQGVIQIFNVGAERMLGYQAADVINALTPAAISDAEEIVARASALSVEYDLPIAPGFEALVFKAARGIEDIDEVTYIRKDGSRFAASVSVTALRDAQGTIIGYLLIGTDNTVRKQAEAAQAQLDQRLRDQQFYTRSLIESNIDALMATDAHGIITDVNMQTVALTGYPRDALIGTPAKNYFTDSALAQASIAQVVREGRMTDQELTVCARDGRETVVSCNATTFHDRDGALQGVFVAARDVTGAKRTELALQEKNVELARARAVADKANLAKSEFLSSMSHELRTPLNAVLGFAQLMESATPSPTPAQKLSIEQILKGGWYLLHLINEILDLAMIEAGKITILPEVMSLSDILQDCQVMIAPQALQRDVEMRFTPVGSGVFAHADRTRVKQVVINLLSNAIKYNRKGGSVTVTCTSTAKRVRITVSDTGAGLSEAQLGQLFQPFNRLGREASTAEGTGIGLVVTKQLVELMGGAIGVSSLVGQGSQFWIELDAASLPVVVPDRAELAPPLAGPASAAPGAPPPRTLLYVEDNPANLDLVEQLIARRSDLKLLTAIDGHIGVQMARAYQPDVILLDINLPGMSGFDVLRILRADPLTAAIPTLALSANAMAHDVENGIKAGFYSYLTKPIKIREFMGELDVALRFAASNKAAAASADGTE